MKKILFLLTISLTIFIFFSQNVKETTAAYYNPCGITCSPCQSGCSGTSCPDGCVSAAGDCYYGCSFCGQTLPGSCGTNYCSYNSRATAATKPTTLCYTSSGTCYENLGCKANGWGYDPYANSCIGGTSKLYTTWSCVSNSCYPANSCVSGQCGATCNGSGDLNTCNAAGASYFRDTCSSCVAADKDNVCKKAGSLAAGDGCTADSRCDGKAPNSACGTSGTCDASCVCKGDDQCTSGDCCDTVTKKYKTSGTVCGYSSWNACNGLCVKKRDVYKCDGTSATCPTTDQGDNTANIPSGKVCDTGFFDYEAPVTATYYCGYELVCTAGSCAGIDYYRSCNGAGSCRLDFTDSYSITSDFYANTGYTLTSSCNQYGTTACGYSAYNGRSTDKCDKKRDVLACDASHNCTYDAGDNLAYVPASKIANASGQEVDASSGDYAGVTCHSCTAGACSGNYKWGECDGSGNAATAANCATYSQSVAVSPSAGSTLTTSCTDGTTNCDFTVCNASDQKCDRRCNSSHVCSDYNCVNHCSNGVKDCDETGVDSGGSCTTGCDLDGTCESAQGENQTNCCNDCVIPAGGCESGNESRYWYTCDANVLNYHNQECGTEYYQCCTYGNANCGSQYMDYYCSGGACYGPTAGTCSDCGVYSCNTGTGQCSTTACSKNCGATCETSADCGGAACSSSCTCGTPTLSVTLTAENPSSGSAPLNDVDLSADVGGTAAGTVIFQFHCNAATSPATWEHTFDSPAIDFSTTDASPVNRTDSQGHTHSTQRMAGEIFKVYDLCDYASAGTYTPRVRVQRSTAPSPEATASITVTSGAVSCVAGGTCTTEGDKCCSGGKLYTCQNISDIKPSEDTWVREFYPDWTGAGTQSWLFVGFEGNCITCGQNFPYLKFDLSTIPAGSSITLANLTLYTNDSVSIPINIRKVANDTWTESVVGALTWNSRSSYPMSNILTSGTINNGWNVFNVTSYVQIELAGDKTASFGLEHTGTCSANCGTDYLVSKENASTNIRPYLRVIINSDMWVQTQVCGDSSQVCCSGSAAQDPCPAGFTCQCCTGACTAIQKTAAFNLDVHCILSANDNYIKNGNLSIVTGGQIQMLANSCLTFASGQQITLSGDAQIIKSETNTRILKRDASLVGVSPYCP